MLIKSVVCSYKISDVGMTGACTLVSWCLHLHLYSSETGSCSKKCVHMVYSILEFIQRRSKKTSNFQVTGLCAGNSPVTGEFLAQRASNAENVSISWRHHCAGSVYVCGLILWSSFYLLIFYLNPMASVSPYWDTWGPFHCMIQILI